MTSTPQSGSESSLLQSARDLFRGLSQLTFSNKSNSSLTGGWQCNYCTFVNRNTEFLSCEMCGMIRELSDSSKSLVSCEKNKDDSRFAEISAEQEDHLQKSRENHDDEYHRGLVEERMQEIVDRQRVLYDEILEKRVCRESIPFHMKTLRSIKRLQSLLGEDEDLERQHSFTPRTRDCKTPVSDGGGAASAAVTNTAVQSTGPLDRRLLRRASRRAKTIENPATTMKTNPWEERTVGIQDLLNVQEELWERVSGKEVQQQRQQEHQYFPFRFRGKKPK